MSEAGREAIVNLVMAMTDEERADLLAALRRVICVECGREHPLPWHCRCRDGK